MKRSAALLLLLTLTACQDKGIQGLQTYTYAGGNYRSGSIQYLENPPVGGPHNALWQTCGTYTAPLYNEYAVHTLALGAVWITYQPGLDATQLATLKTLQTDHPRSLLSPYPRQDSPITITAWNAQLKVEKADDPRLNAFLKAYEPGPTAPERGATCQGGFNGTR